jgi:hypothetical protein
MRDEWKLKGGWRIKPKLSRDPEYARYVERMAKQVRAENPELYSRPKPVKPEGMSQEDWIYSMQAKSTQEIITKQKDPDYKRDWTEPLPENVLANPNAKTKGELVGKRAVTLEEVSHVEAIRRRSKNTRGQSDKSSVSKESKVRAMDHFLHHPGVPENLLSDDEIIAAKDIPTPVKGKPASLQPNDWREVGVMKAIYNFCTGKKVRYRK